MISLINKAIVGVSLLVSFAACSKENYPAVLDTAVDTNFNLYHLPKKGWVGDVMPYYNGSKFEIYYLNDATDLEKQSSSGQHPIFKLSTNNLIDMTDEGEIIPYGNVRTQDHLIGTGSLLHVGDKAYFYYTGHNSSSSWLSANNPDFIDVNPREAVMVAHSNDGKSWTKQMQPILKAPTGYELNEFRDPYAFYNAEFSEYWMLVSAQKAGKGYLLCYTTKDPAKQQWQFQGPLDVEGDYLMLECADVFKIGNMYYLLFAEDWSGSRGTHYRVANSTKGVWKKPERDQLDGLHFYAAKTASDGKHRYAFAWAHRRTPENDKGTLTWAGNLLSHEIYAMSDQQLGVKIPQAVVDKVSKSLTLNAVVKDGANRVGSAKTAIGTNESVQFAAIEGTQRFELAIGATQRYSFKFGKEYEIAVDPASGMLQASLGGTQVTAIAFTPTEQQNFHIVCDGSIVVVYLNNEVALTNRIYTVQGQPWSIANGQGTMTVKSAKGFGL